MSNRSVEQAIDLYNLAVVEALAFGDGPEAKSFLRIVAEADCFDVRIRTARWFQARKRRADRRRERANRWSEQAAILAAWPSSLRLQTGRRGGERFTENSKQAT